VFGTYNTAPCTNSGTALTVTSDSCSVRSSMLNSASISLLNIISPHDNGIQNGGFGFNSKCYFLFFLCIYWIYSCLCLFLFIFLFIYFIWFFLIFVLVWASLVNRDGVVCSVGFSGTDRQDQWVKENKTKKIKQNKINNIK
jgi:hypothetical protein